MYRTHTCGELRMANVGQTVTLAGWVQRIRKMGGMSFIDLRDRYGITQLVVDDASSDTVKENLAKLGREAVIQAVGRVAERQSKNAKIDTGDIEIILSDINILNLSATPPFTIEDNSDGG
ncbi:MAG: aspartate--tRNA ligase, partial [Bacteroidales bacterium]|nr:aspartate--tRNA ligase [Bacteroidales bacterium]